MRFIQLVFTIIIVAVALMLHRTIEENMRLQENIAALTSETLLYRTKYDHSAASVAALRLSVGELRKQNHEAERVIAELNLKLRRATSYGRAVTETRFRDTLIINTLDRNDDNLPRSGEVAYNDRWLRIAGSLWGDSLSLEIRSIDTLHQVVHRIPRRLLGIPFGTKYLRQEIISSNPHTTLVYSEFIEIGRRTRNRR